MLSFIEWKHAMPPVWHHPDLYGMTIGVLFWDAFWMFWVGGTMAFLPAAVAVLMAEMFALRSIVYHMSAGAVAAGLSAFFIDQRMIDFPVFEAPAIIAAGFVGGFVYWLVAGSTSGPRRAAEPPARTPAPPPYPGPTPPAA